MTWTVEAIVPEGTLLRETQLGHERILPIVDVSHPYDLSGRDDILPLLGEADQQSADRQVRAVATEQGMVSVHTLAGARAIWVDHAASPRGDDLVALLKLASPAARLDGRLLVIAGLVAISPDDDYDSLPALAAAVIRLRVDQWVGLGIEAKALATQVGLEGSWDGESMWLEQAAHAYDYLRVWAGESDVILLTGHRFGELPGLLEKVAVTG